MPIIAISGKAGVGKDTFSDILVKEYGFEKFSFADDLRDFCSRVFNLKLDNFLDRKLKDNEFNTPINIDFHHIDKMRDILITEYGYEITYDTRELMESFEGSLVSTPRQLLRIVGNSIVRDCVDDEIWVKRTLYKIKESSGKVVIADCRFETEREILKAIGALLVKVKRGDDGDTTEHEFDLGHDSEYDVVFGNDSTLQQYISNIKLWYSLRRHELEYTHGIDYKNIK